MTFFTPSALRRSGPLAVSAQRLAKVPTIGFLAPNTGVLDGPRIKAFVQRLGELGWVEGRNIAIQYRKAEGRSDHLDDFASELVRLKMDVIVTSATPPTVAAKKATSSIPIVFASVGDPMGAGLVPSRLRGQAETSLVCRYKCRTRRQKDLKRCAK